MKKLLQNAALMLFSVFLTLMVAEITIRNFWPQNLSGSWRVATEKGLIVNKSNGSSVQQNDSRSVSYRFFDPHLRDTPLGNSGFKILVVGDSFTFGWLLNHNDTYVNKLQNYSDCEFGVNQFHFLNGGAGGWGTADYLAFIEDFGDIIKPDIVLVFINTDDIGRSLSSNLYSLSSKSSLSLDRHILKSSSLKKALNTMPGYQWLLEHSHLIQIVRAVVLIKRKVVAINRQPGTNLAETAIDSPNSNDLDISREDSIRMGKALFLKLKKWADAHGVSLIVTTTGWHNLSESNTSKDPTKAFMSIANCYFQSIDIPFFDISPIVYSAMKDHKDNYVILGDGHPNEKGSSLIAEKAWQHFVKDQLIEFCSHGKRCSSRK